MKKTSIKAAALLASLVSATSVMAHSEITSQSGLMAAAHNLAHALQANPWLPATMIAVAIAAFALSRINKRES